MSTIENQNSLLNNKTPKGKTPFEKIFNDSTKPKAEQKQNQALPCQNQVQNVIQETSNKQEQIIDIKDSSQKKVMVMVKRKQKKKIKNIVQVFDKYLNLFDNDKQKKIPTPKLYEARKGLDELGLDYISTKTQDVSELSCILGLILDYPSTSQATSHAKANVLGTYDLVTPEQFKIISKDFYKHSDSQVANEQQYNKEVKQIFDQKVDFDEKIQIFEKNTPLKPKKCPCCGLPQQTKKVKVWQDLHLVSHVGISVNLFFMAIKNVIVLLTIMTLLLTSFSMASNMKSYQIFKETFNRDIFNSTDISNITDFAHTDTTVKNFANNIMGNIPSDLTGDSVDQAIINQIASQVLNKYELDKLGANILLELQKASLAGKYYLQGDPQNRDFARRTFFVECWLGACVIFIWIFVLVYLRYREKQYHALIERLTTTASDFTLLFQNIPKYYAATENNINEKFEKVLQNYLRTLQSKTKVLEIFNIKKPKKKQENKEQNKKQMLQSKIKLQAQDKKKLIKEEVQKNKNSDQKPQQSMVTEGQKIKQVQKHNNEQVVTGNQINSTEKKQQPPKQPSVPSKQPSVPSQPSKQPIDIKIHKVNFIFFFDKKEYYDPKNDFDDPQIKQYNRHIQECRKQFVNTILKRKENHKFHLSDKSRKPILYDRWNNLQKQKKLKHDLIREQKLQEAYYDVKVQQKFQYLSAFVTFENSKSKQCMRRLHNQQSSFLRKLLPFYNDREFFKFPSQTGYKEVIVTLAPEPEDIVWESYQKTDRETFLRKALTYTVVSIILGLSFLSVYKMTQLQLIKSQAAIRGQTISEADQNMSVYISLLLNFINTKLSFIIRYMSKFECNRTYTGQQKSMAIKTIMALCVNSVAIPLLMTILFNKSMYGQNGLADNVLFQTLINCLVNPIQKIINPSYFMLKIKKVKGAQPQQKLNLTQEQLNSRYQEAQFQVGYQYSNLIFMYLFACFYATLQPAVVGITAIGLIFYYWSEKTYFLRFTKRPRKGTKEINDFMFYIICLGPLCYTAGSFFWSGEIYGPETKIPNLICFLLSIIVFFFPYTSLSNKILKHRIQQPNNYFSYDQQRIFLATEYDRLNPFTKKSALKSFTNYQINFLRDLHQMYTQKQQYEQYQAKIYALGKVLKNQEVKQKYSKHIKDDLEKIRKEKLLKQVKQQRNDYYDYYDDQDEDDYDDDDDCGEQEEASESDYQKWDFKQDLKIYSQSIKKQIKKRDLSLTPETSIKQLLKKYQSIEKDLEARYQEIMKYLTYVKRKMKYFSFFVNSDSNKNEYDDQQQEQKTYIKISINVNFLQEQAAEFVNFITCYQQWKKKKQIENPKKKQHGVRIVFGDFDFASFNIEIIRPIPNYEYTLDKIYDFSKFEEYKKDTMDIKQQKKIMKQLKKQQDEEAKQHKDVENQIKKNKKEHQQVQDTSATGLKKDRNSKIESSPVKQ